MEAIVTVVEQPHIVRSLGESNEMQDNTPQSWNPDTHGGDSNVRGV